MKWRVVETIIGTNSTFQVEFETKNGWLRFPYAEYASLEEAKGAIDRIEYADSKYISYKYHEYP